MTAAVRPAACGAAALASLAVLAGLARADEPTGAVPPEERIVVERDGVEIAPAPEISIRAIHVDNRLGDVIVVGHDRPGISLSVVKRAPDVEILDRLKVNLIPDPSGVVSVTSAILFGQEQRPIAAGSVRVDIRMYVPRRARVDVRTWSGKVAISGLLAGASLAAHDGQVTVTDVAGIVSTTTMRGHQQLSDVTGTVTADATYGALALDAISGDSLAARVHQGTVVATRIRSRTAKITTTFGDIRFRGELFAGGRYELRAYRGNVDVRTRGAFRIDAYARDGAIEQDAALASSLRPTEGRLVGRWGAGARPALLEVSSAAGKIMLGVMTD